jgi:hypothetical protein
MRRFIMKNSDTENRFEDYDEDMLRVVKKDYTKILNDHKRMVELLISLPILLGGIILMVI